MDAAASFFLFILALQVAFTGAIIWLVGRRFPARLPLYRFVAPAGLPILFWAMASVSYLAWTHRHDAAGSDALGVLGRLALAYGVLWLFGVILASLVIRLTRR